MACAADSEGQPPAATPRVLLACGGDSAIHLRELREFVATNSWQLLESCDPALPDQDDQVDHWLRVCQRLQVSVLVPSPTSAALLARLGEFAQIGCQVLPAAEVSQTAMGQALVGQVGSRLPDSDSRAAGASGEPRWQLQSGTLTLRQCSGTWPMHHLIDVAARRNSARGYLLVSRVLGKHLPVTPERMRHVHRSLAALLPATLPGPVLFVGMGETATGLGWGVWQAWMQAHRREDVLFVHSTRYPPIECATVAFEEGHSHAPAQVLCVPTSPSLQAKWRAAQTLIVVDDELTTGATAANLADALSAHGLRLREHHAVALVAAESVALTRRSHAAGGWQLHALATIAAQWCPAADASSERMPQGLTMLPPDRGNRAWGRAGADAAPPMPAATQNALNSLQYSASPIYVVAAGECMHPAFEAGIHLESQGHRVLLQSSTRSPVQQGGAIRASLACDDGLGSEFPFFVHNPPPADARVVVMYERGGEIALRAWRERRTVLPLAVWGA